MDRRTILIVDDEPRLRSCLRDAFEDLGYRVLTAGCGEAGLETLKRERVDACTVDMRLPGMSGNEFIVRAHAAHPGLRFVVYTGSWNYELPDELAALGVTAEDVFPKPCGDPKLMAQAIERLLARG